VSAHGQDAIVGSTTRLRDGAARLARRQAVEIGDEFRERRLTLATSQGHAAAAAGLSRTRFGVIERGSTSLTVDELNRIAAVLGLTPSIRVYPDGVPVRDAGHAARLQRFLEPVHEPVTYRVEVPLPVVEGRPERRAWDAVLFRGRDRCPVELEMRLRDVQAVRRRIDLKRRDDPTESFLLLVADTRNNRRVLNEFATLFADLPRLRPTQVRAALAEGRLPPTGILLV
jgi:transcriptional regulator with XRE-family HTH domain